MDLAEFIIKLAPHVAWPLAAVLLSILFVIVLGRPIVDLITEINTFKLSKDGVEISREFRKASNSAQVAVQDIKDNVSAHPASEEHEPVEEPAPDERRNPWLDDAETSPAVAILRAWEGLAEAVNELAGTSGRPFENSVSKSLEDLEKGDVVNHNYVRAVSELRDVRNEVAHARRVPNRAEAVAFISSAWDLVRATRAIEQLRSSR